MSFYRQTSFDFDATPVASVPLKPDETARKRRGALAYHAGASAEAQVEQDYIRRGYEPRAKRWRGKAGEIDLILKDGEAVVFVEVKKSRSFEQAAAQLTGRQMRRIWATVEEYVANEPDGFETDVRIDVALLDAQGQMQILENAAVFD